MKKIIPFILSFSLVFALIYNCSFISHASEFSDWWWDNYQTFKIACGESYQEFKEFFDLHSDDFGFYYDEDSYLGRMINNIASDTSLSFDEKVQLISYWGNFENMVYQYTGAIIPIGTYLDDIYMNDNFSTRVDSILEDFVEVQAEKGNYIPFDVNYMFPTFIKSVNGLDDYDGWIPSWTHSWSGGHSFAVTPNEAQEFYIASGSGSVSSKDKQVVGNIALPFSSDLSEFTHFFVDAFKNLDTFKLGYFYTYDVNDVVFKNDDGTSIPMNAEFWEQTKIVVNNHPDYVFVYRPGINYTTIIGYPIDNLRFYYRYNFDSDDNSNAAFQYGGVKGAFLVGSSGYQTDINNAPDTKSLVLNYIWDSSSHSFELNNNYNLNFASWAFGSPIYSGYDAHFKSITRERFLITSEPRIFKYYDLDSSANNFIQVDDTIGGEGGGTRPSYFMGVPTSPDDIVDTYGMTKQPRYSDVNIYIDTRGSEPTSLDDILDFLRNYNPNVPDNPNPSPSPTSSPIIPDNPDMDLGWLGAIGQIIGGILTAFGETLVGLIEGIANILSSIVDTLPTVFNEFLAILFGWLPPEIIGVISLSIVAMILIAIIKVIRG